MTEDFDTSLKTILDKSTDKHERMTALRDLIIIDDPQHIAAIRALVFDETDDLEVRGEAIEFAYPLSEQTLPDLITLLSHSSPDIRFWSAYGLYSGKYDDTLDFSTARDVLEHLIATDHTLPKYWGWHVDREALPLLEMLYFEPYRQFYIDEDGEQNEHAWQTWLISPALEYTDFINTYRSADNSLPVPEIAPIITPDALKMALISGWENVSFGTYCAKSPAYLLRSHVVIEKDSATYTLLCGLQNDGYSIVVTGYTAVVYEFVSWLRSIIVDRALYLYEWAGEGISLKSGITATDIEAAYEAQQAAYRTVP